MTRGKNTLSEAESELIDLLRRYDGPNFTLKIELGNRSFRLDLTVDIISEPATGTGGNFSEAWQDLTAESARQ